MQQSNLGYEVTPAEFRSVALVAPVRVHVGATATWFLRDPRRRS